VLVALNKSMQVVKHCTNKVLDWRCQLTCIMAIKRRWWLLYVATIVHLHCSLHSDIAGRECFVLVIDHHISLANCNALNGLPAKSKKKPRVNWEQVFTGQMPFPYEL